MDCNFFLAIEHYGYIHASFVNLFIYFRKNISYILCKFLKLRGLEMKFAFKDNISFSIQPYLIFSACTC